MGVGHDSGGPEGLAQRGQVKEEVRREKVGAFGENSTSDVQLWDSDRGDTVGHDGTPPNRGGGLQEHRGSRSVVEDVLSCV